jgi:hypothetical protein
MDRYKELLQCFLKPYVPGEPRCSIIEDGTTWEGERWTELHTNGNSISIGGMVFPLYTQFLVCKEHEPKCEDEHIDGTVEDCEGCQMIRDAREQM